MKNMIFGKVKQVSIITIGLIIGVSYGLFFYFQNDAEQNITQNIFEQQKNDQLKETESLSRHISTDLNSIVDNLRGLSNSIYLQQGDLSSDKAKKLAEETYIRISNITDRLIVADKNYIETMAFVPKEKKVS